MRPLELPQSSRPMIGVAVTAIACASAAVLSSPHSSLASLILLFFLSGFFADMLTAFFHFGFDYVFPYGMPVLGPISREFREHHEEPTLDPSSYRVNFTKGAYASLPLALIALAILYMGAGSHAAFLIGGTVAGMSLWAIFFHQIHSYAHMGAHVSPEVFKARVDEIARIDDPREQARQFDAFFAEAPIPWPVRMLQKARILLNPATHNLHHLQFESDFSSVNGWSDPVTNPLFRYLARHYKAKAAQTD